MTKRRPARRRRTQPHRPTRARTAQTPEAQQVKAEAQQQARTVKAKTRFLRDFALCGVLLRSAQAAKVGRRTVYDWLTTDDAFKAFYREAVADSKDALVEEARRRGVDGVLEPVFQGGQKVGSIRKYSDTLLALTLRAKLPETFRERYEHSGPKGGPIPIGVTGAVTMYLPENFRGARP
jgi:hypothetical protein